VELRSGLRQHAAAFEKSMDKLGLETLDLYLIHWLRPMYGKYLDTWKASSNCRSRDASEHRRLELHHRGPQEIIDETGVVPVINQVESHPYFAQTELRAFHAEKGILHQAYSPLGSGKGLLEDPVLQDIAPKRNATPARSSSPGTSPSATW
jgi:2,5-diketo-D-gluconate reductase A